jgi:hypothetical protein
MGLSKITLDRSDITTYPIRLKYSSSYASASAGASGISLNRGKNIPYWYNNRQCVIYRLARQLYYNEYLTGSLLNSASYWDSSPQSTAARGTNDDDYRYFPDNNGAEITVLAMPTSVFGERISKKTLSIKGSTYNLIDDGNGNIIDLNNSSTHVGNVLYSQGVVVLTNQDYASALIAGGSPGTTTTTTAAPTPTTTTTTAGPTTTSTTTTTTTSTPTTTTTSTTTTTTTSTPTTTTTSTTTSTTTAAPTTTTTSTTTSTTTATPTTTTTTTTSTTTTLPYDVLLQFYPINSGGSINMVGYVSYGTVADNLTFDGEITKYTSNNCSTGGTSGITFSIAFTNGDITGTTRSDNAISSASGILSAKVDVLSIVSPSTTITTNPEDVIIGSTRYRIQGYLTCTTI